MALHTAKEYRRTFYIMLMFISIITFIIAIMLILMGVGEVFAILIAILVSFGIGVRWINGANKEALKKGYIN